MLINRIMETNINYYKRETIYKDNFKPKKQNLDEQKVEFSEILKNINKRK